jgi:hypothetical protein
MKKKNTTDQDIEKAKAEPKAANYRMTREEADEFFRTLGSSLEERMAANGGIPEETAIQQAMIVQKTFGETEEKARQRIAINKDHDDIYDDAFFLNEQLKKKEK